jgi:hypothetical protein
MMRTMMRRRMRTMMRRRSRLMMLMKGTRHQVLAVDQRQ